MNNSSSTEKSSPAVLENVDSNKRKAFIIGNGFDLDLGYPTSYHIFYEYEFGSVSNVDGEQEVVLSSIRNNTNGKDSLLFHVLRQFYEIDNWMSLENILMHYYLVKTAIIQEKCRDSFNDNKPVQDMFDTMIRISNELKITNIVDETVDENDKLYFNTLKQDLKTYLTYATNVPVKSGSIASLVLEFVCRDGGFTIFNFNYTSLDYMNKLGITHTSIKNFSVLKIGKQLTVDGNKLVNGWNNLHGDLCHGIILGIHESIQINKRYEYIHKHVDNTIENINLQNILENASDVIFFGHSFGLSDIPYFKNFFEKSAQMIDDGEEPVHITIITYDEKSRNDIRDNICKCLPTDKREQFFQNVRILCTIDLYNWAKFVDSLGECLCFSSKSH